MKSLLMLVLIVALGAGGYMSKPDEAAHKANADKQLSEERKDSDIIGAILTSVFEDRKDTFEDLFVATKYTVKSGDKVKLECWGAFTQFMCSKPGEEPKT